jgi:sigma-B regulation protein RsbU (phosphoserine phosphatase)
VVEDSIAIRRVIGAFLSASNFTNVEFAEDGLIGLEKVETFDPDIVILDIRMPNLDGFGFLSQLRANPKYADLPVLVQTAYTDPEERNKVFIAGGTDLTSKPINGIELMARVKIHLENRMLVRSLQEFRNRLENELSAGRKMQMALLPPPERIELIKETHGLDIENYFEPSSELGGDFWDVKDLGDHRVSLSIADFSGHGVNSALNTFRLHTLMDEANMPSGDPAEYLTVLNKKLTTLIPRGQFATMFYGIVNRKTDQLTYCAAASTSPIVGNVLQGDFQFLEAIGTPLGISQKASYENRVIDFPPGSFLFLYSDALTETVGIDTPMLDEDGLGELLSQALDPAQTQHPFVSVLDSFGARVSRPLPDDLTAVWLARC